MRKRDRERIRVCDRVRIVTPELFIRCGYPLTLQSETAAVQEEFGEQIQELLLKSGMHHDGLSLSSHRSMLQETVKKVAREIAYGRNYQKHFGGSERKIYTQTVEKWRDKIVQVKGIQIVKTGHYMSGGFSDYERWEYEPPELESQKAHKILFFSDESFEELGIEAIHVEKIFEDWEEEPKKKFDVLKGVA